MIFNSIEFIVFFIVFFVSYWFIFKGKLKQQNLLILIGSYFFYAYWDWRFLSLIVVSSLIGFYLGKLINNSSNTKIKRRLLFIGIFQGLCVLFFFKYYNFFISSFVELFSKLDITINLHTLKIILPIGISFYTFKILSYLIDIYKGKVEACNDWIAFFSYVAFFPCLTSGPIDKAKKLIPQLMNKRIFVYDQASDGLRQILWGLFKKIVIADNCATLTNYIFENHHILPASSLLIGVFFYAIQLYADFSGYTDMAIGVAKLLGFEITKNFDFPYFSKNIAEFWRKWHISLTSWMTEYVFTPLNIAFRDWGKLGIVSAVLINFLIIGTWHGANWTFIIFGLLHGLLFLSVILRPAKKKKKSDVVNLLKISTTFFVVMLTLVFFRVDSINDALSYYYNLLSPSLFSFPVLPYRKSALITLIFIILFIIVEWIQKDKHHGLQLNHIKNSFMRLSIYYILIFCIILFGNTDSNQFIYFNF